MILGDTDDTFLSYSYDKERSKVLCSIYKHPLPNIFQATAFKKRAKMFIEERSGEDFSPLFFFLPSTTNHKKKKLTIFLAVFICIQLILLIKKLVIIL